MTHEGIAAVDEAIHWLESHPAGLDKLHRDAGMGRACEDHVEDTGPEGLTGHLGSKGSSPYERLERYGNWKVGKGSHKGVAGENLAYSNTFSGEEFVLQMLIDDGVSDRGHRLNLMEPKWGVTGIAIGEHAKTAKHDFKKMLCINYAGAFEDNNEL